MPSNMLYLHSKVTLCVSLRLLLLMSIDTSANSDGHGPLQQRHGFQQQHISSDFKEARDLHETRPNNSEANPDVAHDQENISETSSLHNLFFRQAPEPDKKNLTDLEAAMLDNLAISLPSTSNSTVEASDDFSFSNRPESNETQSSNSAPEESSNPSGQDKTKPTDNNNSPEPGFSLEVGEKTDENELAPNTNESTSEQTISDESISILPETGISLERNSTIDGNSTTTNSSVEEAGTPAEVDDLAEEEGVGMGTKSSADDQKVSNSTDTDESNMPPFNSPRPSESDGISDQNEMEAIETEGSWTTVTPDEKGEVNLTDPDAVDSSDEGTSPPSATYPPTEDIAELDVSNGTNGPEDINSIDFESADHDASTQNVPDEPSGANTTTPGDNSTDLDPELPTGSGEQGGNVIDSEEVNGDFLGDDVSSVPGPSTPKQPNGGRPESEEDSSSTLEQDNACDPLPVWKLKTAWSSPPPKPSETCGGRGKPVGKKSTGGKNTNDNKNDKGPEEEQSRAGSRTAPKQSEPSSDDNGIPSKDDKKATAPSEAPTKPTTPSQQKTNPQVPKSDFVTCSNLPPNSVENINPPNFRGIVVSYKYEMDTNGRMAKSLEETLDDLERIMLRDYADSLLDCVVEWDDIDKVLLNKESENSIHQISKHATATEDISQRGHRQMRGYLIKPKIVAVNSQPKDEKESASSCIPQEKESVCSMINGHATILVSPYVDASRAQDISSNVADSIMKLVNDGRYNENKVVNGISRVEVVASSQTVDPKENNPQKQPPEDVEKRRMSVWAKVLISLAFALVVLSLIAFVYVRSRARRKKDSPGHYDEVTSHLRDANSEMHDDDAFSSIVETEESEVEHGGQSEKQLIQGDDAVTSILEMDEKKKDIEERSTNALSEVKRIEEDEKSTGSANLALETVPSLEPSTFATIYSTSADQPEACVRLELEKTTKTVESLDYSAGETDVGRNNDSGLENHDSARPASGKREYSFPDTVSL